LRTERKSARKSTGMESNKGPDSARGGLISLFNKPEVVEIPNFEEGAGGVEADLVIPSHLSNHNGDHVDNFEEIEAEDYVSNSLIKDSPVLKIKNKKPVQHFMMNLKVALNEDTFS